MKLKFLYLILISTFIFLAGGIYASTNDDLPPVSISKLPEPTPASNTKSEIEEIKIAGATIATINGGDFDNPTFAPDGRQIAYSKKVDMHSEIYLFDLQKQSKSILLSSKQSQKYVPDGSQVFTLNWLGANKLSAYLSDGDVGGATITFNTQTRRIIKGVKESYVEEAEGVVPRENLAIYNLFLKTFPDIPKDAAKHAFYAYPIFKIKNRGVVMQFRFDEMDSNVWYFDFPTKKKYMLAEAPKEGEMEFALAGASEIAGNILFLTEYKGETTFSIFQNEKTAELFKTDYKGDFEPLFSNAKKSIFLLNQADFDTLAHSSLWIFDGKTVKRASDLEQLINADIDSTGSKIAFSYTVPNFMTHITVKKLNDIF